MREWRLTSRYDRRVNVVLLAYQTWGTVTLEALLSCGRHRVPLVVTHPEGRDAYESIWMDSVASLAGEQGIPVVECWRLEESRAALAMIEEAAPDIFLASDWRTWVPPEILKMARWGGVNLHDAPLPRYGGFAPVNWAIVNGEESTAVTAHFMSEELDLGHILEQAWVPIHFTDTAVDVVRRTLPLFGSLALRALDSIEAGTHRPVPQDPAHATFFHRRTERDSRIDWGRPSVELYNLVRAQADPYPNAFCFHEGRRLSVKRAGLPERAYCGTPGRVVRRTEHGVVVVCGSATAGHNQGLVLVEVQPEGGCAMPANDYFRCMGGTLD
jgi:methionyl-tRNA formyltransferase